MTAAHDKLAVLRTETVYKDIAGFLNRKNIGNGDTLKSTAADYKRDIERFFSLMMNKDLNELEIPDLFVMRKDVEEFQTLLANIGFKSNTINRHINSLRSLYKFFEENASKYRFRDSEGELVQITHSAWNVDPVVMNDSESWGMYTDEEVKQMIELAKTLHNGERKSLAIEFASVSSFRIDAVANLEYSDFRKEGDTWVVKHLDKKKIHEKSIRSDLYERLLAVKEDSSNKVFDLNKKTLQRTIHTLNEMMGLDEERNLTFHSIKKYGIGEVYMITGGDRLATASQGNHNSFETAEKYYLLFQKNYANMPSLMIGQKLDTSPLQDLDKDGLIDLIESMPRSVQFEILNKLKK
ncbi:tyrosine-type recombinase/integrase [Paenibacillus sp. FSL R7-0302]|uniref:tyrosine-type recombinase/integrase n=1 Tax=Paenibacillus sp. FSL R7-0302 TaxID=2921681 RepID=UPI0030F74FB8